MSDSGWMNHPKYGTVYQPDLSGARVAFNTEYDAWHGPKHDALNDLLDDVQYAAMRTVLTDLRSVLMAGGADTADVVRIINAMLDTLADHQHGGES